MVLIIPQKAEVMVNPVQIKKTQPKKKQKKTFPKLLTGLNAV